MAKTFQENKKKVYNYLSTSDLLNRRRFSRPADCLKKEVETNS
jgi:hypothetical protein